MLQTDRYRTLRGETIELDGLDAEERKLLDDLAAYYAADPNWALFRNHWMAKVAEFYAARGLSRPQIRQTAVYRAGQDMAGRLMVRAGLARVPDYRDELERFIRERFRTRREFCQATGLSEDLLSHVLNRRKHLGIDTLVAALARIGYTIHIAPIAETVA